MLAAVCRQAELVIVMTDTARGLLVEGGTCPFEKVRVVPHGAPPVLARRGSELAIKRALGEPTGPAGSSGRLDDRFLLSTFGLISEGKGLETAIEALPAIVERHPDVMYVIAGRTHPDVAHREGERYRMTLERAVLDLGLEGHVEFDDRFLSIERSPISWQRPTCSSRPTARRSRSRRARSPSRSQRGAGWCRRPTGTHRTCSSPGPARSCRSPIPPPSQTRCAATSSEPASLMAARAEAGASARSLPGRRSPPQRRRSCARRSSWRRAGGGRSLDPQRVTMRTDHLLTLVDDVGIIQHANGVIPNRESGYCVDDVARLAVVALELARRGDEQVWTSIVYRSLAFLQDATDADRGLRNFMGYDRRWLDAPHHRRPRRPLDLGARARFSRPPGSRPSSGRASDCWTRSCARFPPTSSLRTGAYAALGLARLDPDRLDPAARALLKRVLEQLADAYTTHSGPGWLWFEERLTYDNARLPHALIVGGVALGDDTLTTTGLAALRWLGDESGLAEGVLRLTGHAGRDRAEPAPGDGDEQPLDASAFVEAELAAFVATGDPEHGARAQKSFDWFLGRNKLQRPLYDFATGGCSDGLGDETTNDNEGAESTLAFHRAALLLDTAGLPAVQRQGTRQPVPA